MNGMTIKQVAKLCLVDEGTIYRWIQKGASAECKASLAKCKAANEENKPARFTLPETIAIIKAGGRSTLADLHHVLFDSPFWGNQKRYNLILFGSHGSRFPISESKFRIGFTHY